MVQSLSNRLDSSHFHLWHFHYQTLKPDPDVCHVFLSLQYARCVTTCFILILSTYFRATFTIRNRHNCRYTIYSVFLLPNISSGIQGYHRLWSHRAYNASKPLQYFLAIAGASSVQGAIWWWARGHRSHHRLVAQHRSHRPYLFICFQGLPTQIWIHIMLSVVSGGLVLHRSSKLIIPLMSCSVSCRLDARQTPNKTWCCRHQ